MKGPSMGTLKLCDGLLTALIFVRLLQECHGGDGPGGQLAGGAEAADPRGDHQPQRGRAVHDDLPLSVPQRQGQGGGSLQREGTGQQGKIGMN